MTTARDRVVHGWEHGFSSAETPLVATLAGGYRCLIGTRDWLYARGMLKSRRLSRPVVAVGNLTVGGTGKTPAVMAAVETLIELGHRPAVVSRGYGRRTDGVRIVADTAAIRVEPEDAGDEPFLLARRLPGVPVIVGANRADAAAIAIDRFDATVIVLDDGFQHRTLAKDLEIVMARAHGPWGNGRLLPAGPLREPLDALARAHLVIATGARHADDTEEVAAAVARYAPGVPVLPAAHVATECWDARRMAPMPLEALRNARVLAFAGIGTPSGFARTLADAGADVADLVAFGDHHWYGAREIAVLAERAQAFGAEALVTTEKDWVRLLGRAVPPVPLWVVSVRLELLDGAAVWREAFTRACSSA
ncbi:MAG: tetraacyldisaccharide 4'-kinase [Candidatus Rokubacteria bacterium]|nr:tetraacyldisaccharide 4'-kinase [Candidatus Rokubacteria bacterium]